MKLLVKTNNVLLLGINGDVYEPLRPSVVRNDSFCQTKVAAGVVTVLKANLPEQATDAEWAKFYAESDTDVELALESFLAKFEAEPDMAAEAKRLEEEARLKDAEARNALAVQQQAEAEAAALAEAEAAAKAKAEADALAEAEAAEKAKEEALAAAAAEEKQQTSKKAK